MSELISDPYSLMQRAVDIVGTSEHPANKIAATIAGMDAGGGVYVFSFTNYWPALIRNAFGIEGRIGNSSGTVHAETACLIRAPMTKGASMFVTDPPCPNCVKNMAEAGIYKLYIDHKGFDKDFAQRRGEDFKNLSLHMCEKAAIDIYKVFRKDRRIETIFKTPEDYKPPIENPAATLPVAQIDEAQFKSCVVKMQQTYGGKAFALGLTRDHTGQCFMIAADAHPMPGFTSGSLEETGEKYSLILQPMNRITMTAARKGLQIDPDFVFSSHVPTSRALVNLVGTGITKIYIQDIGKSRDPSGIDALRQLQKAGILSVRTPD